jgi:hypothetical protein
MKGWSINIHRPDDTREVEREQPPVLVLDGGEIVFEVWFWHARSARWFVMTWQDDPSFAARGIVAFRPTDVPSALRERVAALRSAA